MPALVMATDTHVATQPEPDGGDPDGKRVQRSDHRDTSGCGGRPPRRRSCGPHHSGNRQHDEEPVDADASRRLGPGEARDDSRSHTDREHRPPMSGPRPETPVRSASSLGPERCQTVSTRSRHGGLENTRRRASLGGTSIPPSPIGRWAIAQIAPRSDVARTSVTAVAHRAATQGFCDRWHSERPRQIPASAPTRTPRPSQDGPDPQRS